MVKIQNTQINKRKTSNRNMNKRLKHKSNPTYQYTYEKELLTRSQRKMN